MAQQVFKLGSPGNTIEENKTASLHTVIMVGTVTTLGIFLYFFFNSELKRSKL